MANPRNACDGIDPPFPQSEINYFVLVDDGGCSYYEKVIVICCYK